MEILAALAVILFSILGLMVCVALKAASREASAMGDHLIAESQRVQAEFDQAVADAHAAMAKPPTQVVITEQFEPQSNGRQLTEHELREIIYSGVGLVLERKKDQAELAAELAQTMKRSLDIRVKES